MKDEPIGAFEGFPKDTLKFLSALKRNNTRESFERHREDYERHFLAPAKAFVVAMGERLRTIVPGIIAVPKVDRSIFRLNRDTRFSLDPSPYKTNLGIYFWEGASKFEATGFYFHIEPPEFILGGGAYEFSKTALTRYRKAAAEPARGRKLAAIVADLRAGGFEVGGARYKRVPAGFDPEHPNAELLKHGGLHAGITTTPIPDIVFSPDLPDHCFGVFKRMLPLQQWLAEVLR